MPQVVEIRFGVGTRNWPIKSFVSLSGAFDLQVNAQKAACIESDKGSMSANETALPDVQIVAFDPMYFSEIFQQPICTARTHPLKTTMHPSSLICTRAPSMSTDKYGTTACVMYARTLAQLLSTPTYPSSPTPIDYVEPVAYEIRDTKSKGKAMFTTRALETGDLILEERPLIVVPINIDLSGVAGCPEGLREEARIWQRQGVTGYLVGVLEPMLEVAFERMSKENQKRYMTLHNAHASDGTPKLSGIWRTNVFEAGGLGEQNDKYGAVLNEMSRINHSCRANCALSFDKASMSFELRATKAIAAGEEVFYSYATGMDTPTDNRQARIKPYGFSCTCISCCPTPTHPANDAIRTSVVGRRKSLYNRCQKFNMARTQDRETALTMYDESVSILRDMGQEGMDGYGWFKQATELHIALCKTLGRLSETTLEADKWLDVGKRYTENLRKVKLAFNGSKGPKDPAVQVFCFLP